MIFKGDVKFRGGEWQLCTHAAKENMASRFATSTTSTEEEIERLLTHKNVENTKRSTKVTKELFHKYLRGTKFRNRKTRKGWQKF